MVTLLLLIALAQASESPPAEGPLDASAQLCSARTLDAITSLLQAGADPAVRCGRAAFLHRLVAKQDEALVRGVLEQGVDVDLPGPHGGAPRTPLHVAAAEDWRDGVRLLLEAGADPNARIGLMGVPPLAVADSVEVAVLLVEAGAERTLGSKHLEAPEVWAPREPGAGESGAFLLAWAKNTKLAGLPLKTRDVERAVERSDAATVARLVDSVGLEAAQAALARSRLYPCSLSRDDGRAAVRRKLGAPVGRQRDGVVTTVTYEAGEAAFGLPHRPLGRAPLLSVTGGCVSGSEDLLGLPRDAVWLFQRPPEYPGVDSDVWESGLRVDYEEGVVKAVGVDFRLR